MSREFYKETNSNKASSPGKYRGIFHHRKTFIDMPEWIKRLGDGATAILVETRVNSKESLDGQIGQIKKAIADIEV